MSIFHHKVADKETRVMANGRTRLSSVTIFVHLFISSVIQKVTIVTLNIILHKISYLAYLAHTFPTPLDSSTFGRACLYSR